MDNFKHPTKEQVRAYMQRRIASHTPLPDLEQIKRELGFGLVELQPAGKSRL